MKTRAILTLAAALAAGPCLAATAPVQPAPATAPAPPAQRPAARHPDFNGVWSAMNSANFDIQAHAARAAMQLRAGPVGPVPAKAVVALGAVGAVPSGLGVVDGGEIPYKPEALARKKENQEHWLDRDPEIKCYLPGVPRANYMALPFQIFQSEKSMIIAYEYAGAVRNVLFNDPGPAPVDSWMGQSVAKWDGDTLVITVSGMLDRPWFDRAGNFHSDQMSVVERWTPTGPGVIRYEATITDPETFTRPWKMSFNLYKHVGDDARLNQFKCVEFVEELMYGDLRKEPLK